MNTGGISIPPSYLFSKRGEHALKGEVYTVCLAWERLNPMFGRVAPNFKITAMNHKALQLYEQMQTDLALCRRKEMGMLKEIECCFHIAERYWAILRHELLNYEFISEEEEIEFFKHIKPKFTSETEYYGLLCHAWLFRQESTPEDLSYFWKRESRRLEKFKLENKVFYERRRSGHTETDHLCFVRKNREEGTVSGHDHLAAVLLALERYDDYISNEIKMTNSQDPGIHKE